MAEPTGDPVIDQMVQQILTWRQMSVPVHQLREWTTHLRDVVGPQLAELKALKARRKTDK